MNMKRRDFLKAGAAITFVIVLEPFGCKRKIEPKDESVQNTTTTLPSQGTGEAVGAWVTIYEDNSIVVQNPAAEMGQGSATALPAMIVEEMDGDWSKVTVVHSPVDPDVYGRSWGRSASGGGTMMTVGSHTVPGYFLKLRLAGAAIRKALLAAAAESMDVPLAELFVADGIITHAKTQKSMTFGDIVKGGNVPESLPNVDEEELKSSANFKILGKTTQRTDIPSKVDGSAVFSIDVNIEGMEYAMIQRSPIPNGRPLSYNETEVNKIEGVSSTFMLDHGVAVVADSMEGVYRARQALHIKWDETVTAAGFDSESALLGYRKQLSNNGHSVEDLGDTKKAFKSAAKTYNADYLADFVVHAQMEPLNAVVSVKSDSAEVWLGSQSPARARSAVAGALGLDEDKVTMHRCMLGGGFGRRSAPDYAVEAALISQKTKKPVKLIWTREDDIQYGMFRPQCLQSMSAAVDADGNLIGWKHALVGDGGRLLASGSDIDYYNVPNKSISLHQVDHGLRLHYWRAVGHGYNKFAIEAFLDEIAAGQSVDPIEFRRRIASPRMAKVLDAVVEMSDWSNTPEGRAKGIALAERSKSLAAGVAEISVDKDSGEIRVHKFWAALDSGIIVQPDNAVAQIEGSIVMALSTTLIERLSLKNGRVEQSNFHDYPILRMSQTPEMHVKFLESNEPPKGVGEPGVPIVPAAVANAFAKLTGKRLRHMPFTPERVKETLK